MSLLYGVYLLFTLGCTYYVIYKNPLKKWKSPDGKEISHTRLIWIGRRRKVAAILIVLGVWWFQNEYRHNYSIEAKAMKQFDELLDKWQAGKKEKVIKELDWLADSIRPWEPIDETQHE